MQRWQDGNDKFRRYSSQEARSSAQLRMRKLEFGERRGIE